MEEKEGGRWSKEGESQLIAPIQKQLLRNVMMVPLQFVAHSQVVRPPPAKSERAITDWENLMASSEQKYKPNLATCLHTNRGGRAAGSYFGREYVNK